MLLLLKKQVKGDQHSFRQRTTQPGLSKWAGEVILMLKHNLGGGVGNPTGKKKFLCNLLSHFIVKESVVEVSETFTGVHYLHVTPWRMTNVKLHLYCKRTLHVNSKKKPTPKQNKTNQKGVMYCTTALRFRKIPAFLKNVNSKIQGSFAKGWRPTTKHRWFKALRNGRHPNFKSPGSEVSPREWGPDRCARLSWLLGAGGEGERWSCYYCSTLRPPSDQLCSACNIIMTLLYCKNIEQPTNGKTSGSKVERAKFSLNKK